MYFKLEKPEATSDTRRTRSRLNMLTSWLTITVMAAAAAVGRTSVTVAPTRRLEAEPEAQLTLTCGEKNGTGEELRFWHTPFGDLQTPGFHGAAVFLQPDGSLLIFNSSVLHSGFYYCLLQLSEETRLQPYKLQVHTFSREAGGLEAGGLEAGGLEKQQDVSDGLFAGAVAASVMITFVLGFSAGALTRTHVLRCFRAVTAKLKSPQRHQSDVPDHGAEVAMTTLPPTFDNQEIETVSSTTSSPPKKPQRSFRYRRDEEQETTEYLQGCDHKDDVVVSDEKKEEVERSDEENEGSDEEAEGSDEENEGSDEENEGSDEENEGSDEEAEGSDKEVEGSDEEAEGYDEETSGFYMVGGDGGSETDEDSEDKMADGDDDEEKNDEDSQTDVCRDSSEPEDNRNQEVKDEPPEPAPRPGRRVIRLYDYNEDGQRYQHLPDSALNAPGPAPRLKQRSLSLTRLNAIMAAASASPLDKKDTKREVMQHFHMEI